MIWAGDLGHGPLRQIQTPGGMAAMNLTGLPALRQEFQPVVTDRLEHPVPRLAVRLVAPGKQALVEERANAIKDGERRGWGGGQARGRGGRKDFLPAFPPTL